MRRNNRVKPLGSSDAFGQDDSADAKRRRLQNAPSTTNIGSTDEMNRPSPEDMILPTQPRHAGNQREQQIKELSEMSETVPGAFGDEDPNNTPGDTASSFVDTRRERKQLPEWAQRKNNDTKDKADQILEEYGLDSTDAASSGLKVPPKKGNRLKELEDLEDDGDDIFDEDGKEGKRDFVPPLKPLRRNQRGSVRRLPKLGMSKVDPSQQLSVQPIATARAESQVDSIMDINKQASAPKEALKLKIFRAMGLKIPELPPPLDKRAPHAYVTIGLQPHSAFVPKILATQPIRLGAMKKKDTFRAHVIDLTHDDLKGFIEFRLYMKDPFGGEDVMLGRCEISPLESLRSMKTSARGLSLDPQGVIIVSTELSAGSWSWAGANLMDLEQTTKMIDEYTNKSAGTVESTRIVHPEAKEEEEAWKEEEKWLTSEGLELGMIHVEDVIKEHKKMTEERLTQVSREVVQQHNIYERLAEEEELAQRRVVATRDGNREILEAREAGLIETVSMRAKKSQQHQRRVMNSLENDVREAGGVIEGGWKHNRQSDNVIQSKRQLFNAKGNMDIPRVRWFRAQWEGAPTVLTIRIDELRAVKDKLFPGRLVMMVTLWDRLGGKPRKYTGPTFKGRLWSGVTPKPVRHQGRFHDQCVTFGQKGNEVFVAVPPRIHANIEMVLTFELIQLRGIRQKVDKCVAWGTFPAFCSNFEPIDGRFKMPLFRGEVDMHVDRHQMLEERIQKDLDSWLCNCYFSCRRISQFDGMIEETVEIEEVKDVPNYKKSQALDMLSRSESAADEVNELLQAGAQLAEKKKIKDGDNITSAKNQDDTKHFRAGGMLDENSENEPEGKNLLKFQLDEKNAPPSDKQLKQDNDFDNAGEEARLNQSIQSESEYEEEETSKLASPEEVELPLLRLVRGKTRYVTVESYRRAVDVQKEIQMREKFEHPLGLAEGSTRITNGQYYAEKKSYKASVRRVDQTESAVKTKMLYQAFWQDLRFKEGGSLREHIGYILLWVGLLWARIYIHYGGQLLYLMALQVSIYTKDFLVYSVRLTYNRDIMLPIHFCGIVIVGWGANIFLFGMVLLAMLLTKWLIGFYPDWISDVMIVYGIVMLVDPLLIAGVDVLNGNTKYGDAFLLYTYYVDLEGNGLQGIFITVICYAIEIVFALALFYYYIVFAHKAGRILDIYNRICRQEHQIFFPLDLEVSLRTLRRVTGKAEKYTSADGTVRKIFSSKYEIHDHLHWNKRRTMFHVAIFNVSLEGERTLHRHFIRNHSGCVVEIFDRIHSCHKAWTHIFNEEFSKRRNLLQRGTRRKHQTLGHIMEGDEKEQKKDSLQIIVSS